MAAPDVTLFDPADASVGVPVGDTIMVYFDTGIDLESAKKSVVLYGADFDTTSGPDIAMWVDEDSGNNPFFLRSPGFQGPVDANYELVYADLTTKVENTTPGTITSQADESGANLGHVLKITPKSGSLAPDVQYTLYLTGDPDTQDVGVSSRTVFDLEAAVGNTGTTGSLDVFGTWEGTVADTLHVKITTVGDIGTAKYKFWYNSLGELSATEGRVTNRRYRRLEDGLQLRFSGSGFVLDDEYTFNLEPIERMASSYKIAFTTNDGSYSASPTSPSTPAEASVPASVLPGVVSTTSALTVTEMTPANGSYNNKNSTRTITIVFSDSVDAATVTDATVKVWKYPVDGYYDGTFEPVELEKTLCFWGHSHN